MSKTETASLLSRQRAEFGQRLPVEQAFFHQRQQITAFLARRAARIDDDSAAAAHAFVINLAAAQRVGAGGIDVLAEFK